MVAEETTAKRQVLCGGDTGKSGSEAASNNANAANNGTCTACSPGQYKNDNGAFWVTQMTAGSAACGTTCEAWEAVCLDCPLGTATSASATQTCADCTSGKYQDQKGQLTCDTCSACPAGEVATICRDGDQQKADSTCVQCLPGHYKW